jgi:hypothetical protein
LASKVSDESTGITSEACIILTCHGLVLLFAGRFFLFFLTTVQMDVVVPELVALTTGAAQQDLS